MSKVKKNIKQNSGKKSPSNKSPGKNLVSKKSPMYEIEKDGTVEKIVKNTKITFPNIDTKETPINIDPSEMKIYGGDNDINVVNFDKKVYELLLSIDISKLNDSRHSTGKNVIKESYHRDILKKYASDMGIHNISLKDKLVEAILNKMEEYGINTNINQTGTKKKPTRK